MLRYLAVAAVIFVAFTLAPGGMAASTPSDFSVRANASLPEELLETVREALGPQAAAALGGPAAPTIHRAKLNATDAEPYDQFGVSVALSGDTALVGAYAEDPDLGSGPLIYAGSAYVFVRSGTTWSPEAKLNAADTEAGDQFGISVALDGDTAVIGARSESPNLGSGPIDSAGSAYVFVRSGTTWSQEAKLNAADTEPSDNFGKSVVLDGDTAVIGAPVNDPDLGGGPVHDSGSAYVFVRSGTTWSQEAKLYAADAEEDAMFGYSVALSGDTVVVGAYAEDPDLGSGPLLTAGSAYVFTRSGSTWSQQAELNAADAEVQDAFGDSVAISGDTAVIGSPGKDVDPGGGPIEGAGAAYVFVRSGATWSQQAKLVAADADAHASFGHPVALDGDTAVVGAINEDLDLGGGPLTDAGSTYVFARSGSTWSQQAKLVATDAEAGDRFGGSVALSGDTVVVGAFQEDPDLGGGPLLDAGSAYVFVGAEMDVQGNGSSIADGDATPSTADHTDFGSAAVGACSAVTRTFTILNTGIADLSLTDSPRVSIGGSNAADFALTSDADTPVTSDSQTTFQVIFDPSFVGLRRATISIANNDADENPYNFSIQGTGIASGSFPDVPPHHWAWRYIESVFCAGLTAGYPDGTYRPDNTVTRAEMAVFLKKGIHGSTYTPPAPDGSHPFSDISGHWAEAWMEELYDEGLTFGYPDNTYRPENRVSRAEMAVFLMKAMHGFGYIPPAPTGGFFSDVSGHWAEAWIEQLKEEGITSGYPDGTYRPENQVTRAEMAVFLVNAFNLPLVDPPAIVQFELQTGSPTYIPDERGCEHMGVGGKVYTLQQLVPIVGLAVRVSGELDGVPIGPLNTLTGSAADRFGFGGYYFELSDTPFASEDTLLLQVLDASSGLGLSEQVALTTYDDCERNLVFVNWVQVGE